MGFKLRREVRDLLPPGVLTANERLLVLELADNCRDDSDDNGPAREGWPGFDWLAEKTDIREDKIGVTLARIASKWIELRVPLGVGKDGRPYFSRTGVRTRFRFPARDVLAAFRGAPATEAYQNGGPAVDQAYQNGPPEAYQNGGPQAYQNGKDRPTNLVGPNPQVFPQRSPQRTTSPPPTPSGPAAATPTVAPKPGEWEEEIESSKEQELAKTIRGIRPAWTMRKILDAIKSATDEGRPWPLIVAAFPLCAADTATMSPGRFPHDGPWWAQAEEQTRPASREERIAAHNAHCETQPRCEHGEPGGNLPMPGDGWQPCFLCRQATKQAKAATEPERPMSTGTKRAQGARDAAAELQAEVDANGGVMPTIEQLFERRLARRESPARRLYALDDPNIIEGEEVA
ncbi:hypothetical protein [Catenuloplanes indicus]|uniref:Uncharacterized protein n=1 Tax=Catenuloplanes indicus TaxID=137267 RepID=A0AAE4B3D5_9ACTN|nr:hypothetical protein [Catenuloplanes indicus]MDQ0363334.1 hypothetical protein [Catenuloplanes indicus]MDQ0371656.1 hypothetical protein [Catenuloplanes indicus]